MSVEVGLCARCAHARRTGNRRGSVFFLCGYAERDPRYPRYPRLPVLSCAAFRPRGADAEEPSEGGDES